MIYLTNTVSAQTVSIPRNDNGGTPSVNPRSYQEGYNAGFEAGEDVGYGEGFASGYTSGYTSGETAGYNSGYSVGYDSGYTSGNTDGYNTGYASGETVGENNIISTFSAMTATTNGVYGSSAHPLSAITVNVQQHSISFVITVKGNTWFELDHVFQEGETLNMKNMTYNPINGGTFISDGDVGNNLRICQGYRQLYTIWANLTYCGANNPLDLGFVNNEFTITPTTYNINGVERPIDSGSTPFHNDNMVLFANTNSGSDCIDGAASVGEITITNSANTITAQYIPTLDENDTPCFYNPLTDNYIYPTSGTAYYQGIINPF